MKVVSDYNSRCWNKFLRIEIGIAPKDEKRLPASELMGIAHLFAKRMGLDNHQWVAVTHKDTDNRHIHIIANRITLLCAYGPHQWCEVSARHVLSINTSVKDNKNIFFCH